jgi:hypothetical protein
VPDRGVRKAHAVRRGAELDTLLGATRSVAVGARPDLLVRFGDEAVAASMNRADHPLGSAVVADRTPGRLDAAGQGRLTHEAVAPHQSALPE